MAGSWTFFDANTPADVNTVSRCLWLLREVSKINRERTLVNTTPQVLMEQINTIVNGHNWYKVHCRKNEATEVVDVVVGYHLLKHRGHKWAVSVAFDPALLPAPNGSGMPGDATNPYVILARELSQVIADDLASFSPPHSSWFSIGDRSSNADGSEPDVARRKTKVGELGWIAENDPVVQAQWHFSAGLEPKPTNSNGVEIPGYGRATDTEIYVTEISKR